MAQVLTDEILDWSFLSKCEPPKWMEEILVANEVILQSYKTVRDVACLTNKRIILSNKQGLTGMKNEVFSIPYRSINMWSSENKGPLDINSELTIWSRVGTFKIKIAAKCDIREFDSILGNGVLN